MPALFKSATFFPLQDKMENIVPYVSSKGRLLLESRLHLRQKKAKVGSVSFAFCCCAFDFVNGISAGSN